MECPLLIHPFPRRGAPSRFNPSKWSFIFSPHMTNSSDSCVGQCAFAFIDRMTDQLGSDRSAGLLNLNYNEFLSAFANASFFETFCKSVQSIHPNHVSRNAGFTMSSTSATQSALPDTCRSYWEEVPRLWIISACTTTNRFWHISHAYRDWIGNFPKSVFTLARGE